MRRYILSFSLLLFAFLAKAQNSVYVDLKWKLKPNEVLSYRTIMDEIDTINHKDLTFNSSIFKGLGASEVEKEQKLLKRFEKITEGSNLITRLKSKKKNVIDIEMSLRDDSSKTDIPINRDKDTTLSFMKQMLKKMSNGIMLRGAIYENGTIKSFYTKNEQKNLLAIFFELPGKAVKLGDSYSIDVNFLSMDQNFNCDSAYKKNDVTVAGIETQPADTIVTLKYDIEEYVIGNFSSPFQKSLVPTSMKMKYTATGKFSIEKGRWLFYNGVLSLSSEGIMSSQTIKRCSLVQE